MLTSAFGAGALFGFGLAFSTMIQPRVVLSFLRFEDMGLMLVLGGAVVVTFLAILELYKRGLADITQDAIFGEIVITHIDDEEAARRGFHEER